MNALEQTFEDISTAIKLMSLNVPGDIAVSAKKKRCRIPQTPRQTQLD
jgi:hypothetical protein